MKTEVVKRDGTVEIYEESKIVKIAQACGIESGDAAVLASDVTKWLKDNSLTKVTSLQIRDTFLNNLKKANPKAADLFSWYETTKD